MRNIELAYLAVAYCMGFILFAINRDKKHLTTSEIAASRGISRHIFFWGLFCSGILFGTLMFGWFIPHFQLKSIFSLIVLILLVFQVLTGFIPARGKKLNIAHLIAAFGLGVSMIVLILSLALEPNINTIVRLIDGSLALAMVVLIAGSKIVKSSKYLLLQWLFFTCWHIAIFITVYFG